MTAPIHVSYPGPTRTIVVAGKRITFEEHRFFGPIVLRADGEIARRQPGERHPFWLAFESWVRQGERVGEDGVCVWG